MIFDGLVVGAYAASPAHRDWDPAAEQAFYAGLADHPAIGAIELPWMGGIHPHEDSWLHARFPTRFGAVLTDIPHTMGRIGADPGYGLASRDAEGRAAALADAQRMRTDILRLNDAQSRRVVGVVELHTAPRAAAGTGDALTRSLAEIAGWDWGGAQLVIEHCDAWRAGQAPEKGFLGLESELDAIAASGTPIGVSLNWGRSVIEGRSPDAAVAHARQAAERGVLRGFIASGAADVDTAFGPAWIDAHLPFAPSPATPHGTAGSLMTPGAIADVFAAAGELEWYGVKVGALPAASMTERLALVAESVAVVEQAAAR